MKSRSKQAARPASRKAVSAKRAGASPAETISVNPGTLEEYGRIPNTDITKFPEIMKKARSAQAIWAVKSFRERARHIRKMRAYIVKNAEKLAEIVSRDNGKSRIDALATEVIPCALAADWYAGKAKENLAPRKLKPSNLLFMNKRSQIIRVPMGVIGIISPWNYPLSIPFGEVIMALMAGNAVVLKVAAATIMVGQAIEKIVAEGNLPEGLFTHVVGSGSAVSTALFENKVDKIFFTGSVPTGKVLMKQAADTLTPLSLELGGKDPMIVLADADLERAANGAAWGGYQNCGQSCGGVERVYVQDTVYDKFLSILKEKTEKIRHGYDDDFSVEVGSMTTKEQLEIVKKQVNDAVKKGARIIAQSSPKNIKRGYYYPATLMTNVNHNMPLMKEETFGPVVPVMKFSTIEEAIAMANDSTMALTSSVWTRDLSLGKKIAEKIHSGVTTINDHLYTHGLSETPWGGWKESGLGRTHSHMGLEEMTHAKLINWELLPARRNLWWFPFTETTYNALLSTLRFAFSVNPIAKIKHGLIMGKYMLKKMFTKWE